MSLNHRPPPGKPAAHGRLNSAQVVYEAHPRPKQPTSTYCVTTSVNVLSLPGLWARVLHQSCLWERSAPSRGQDPGS
jgi:hypothetical protein